jgi:hypothetical protein
MILEKYKKWKETRKRLLYEEPEKVFARQISAIDAISGTE